MDEQGRRAVVRNGYLPDREILTGVGPVAVKVPKVLSRKDEPVVFRSSLVPALCALGRQAHESGPAVTVPEGHCHGADAGGPGGTDRPRGQGFVGLGHQSPEAAIGSRVCRLVPPGHGA